jgi:hypothetical protein
LNADNPIEVFVRFTLFIVTGLVACSADRVKVKGQPEASAASAPAPSVPTSSEAKPVPSDPAADPALVASVTKQVDANNASESKAFDALSADGWTLVADVAEPQAGELSYAPELLATRPDILRTQIASTTPPADAIPAVENVARQASGDMRLTAVAALGRVHSEDAVAALLRLITAFGDDADARQATAPLLMPADLDDPNVPAIASLLDSSALGEVEKNQLAFNLAAIALRDGTSLPSTITLSPSASARIAAMRAQLQN